MMLSSGASDSAGSSESSQNDEVSPSLIVSDDARQKLKKFMSLEYTLPRPGDPEFQRKIYEKREFYINRIPPRQNTQDYQAVKEYRDQHCAREFALYSHQHFLSNFFNPDTHYKGLLIFHGLGTGKCVDGKTRIDTVGGPLVIEELTKLVDLDDNHFDGVGEWYPFNSPLYVWSWDGECRIPALAQRLYRQYVNETMRRVHTNIGVLATTMAHKFMVRRNDNVVSDNVVIDNVVSWQTDVRVGDMIQTPTGWARADRVEEYQYEGWVWDLDVDEHHCYYAENMLTHNTCAGISIAEQFKPLVQKYGTKIYILVSGPVIKTVWKEHLIKCTRETYVKYQDKTSLADDAERQKQKKLGLQTALMYYKFSSYRSFYKKVLGEKIVERKMTQDNKVKTKYRKTEEGKYDRDVAVDRIYHLNNTLIIADESHNLTGNDYGEAVLQVIRNSHNLRIVLLSGTPMKNLADDIVELINFVRPPNSPIERDRIFTLHTNHMMDVKPGGLSYLGKMCRGYVSYLRGADPLTFAKRIDVGLKPPGLSKTKIIPCRMLDFQQQWYDEATRDESDSLDRKSGAVANFALPGLSSDKKSLIGMYGREGIITLKNQLKTNADLLNKKITDFMFNWQPPGFSQASEYTGAVQTAEPDLSESGLDWLYLSDNGRSISGKLLRLPYLKRFSIKFAEALEGINALIDGKKGAGTGFVYSNLVKVGIELFQEVLLQNGYLEYQENMANYIIANDTICHRCGVKYKSHKGAHDFHPSTFVAITGKSSEEMSDYIPEEKQRIIRDVFNSFENREGKMIKLVLGSRVMNEGVSLENIREITILDVYFNFGRVDQVVGRGTRNCSHYKIITETNRYPEVKVYKFAVTLMDVGKMSSEEELYHKAELKYALIKRVERVLKEVSIDCALNRNGNVFREDMEEHKGCVERDDCPAICDHIECDMKCQDESLNKKWFDKETNTFKKIAKEQLDYSTFTNRLARDEIESAKARIKDLYRLGPVYRLKDIVSYVKNSYTEVHQQELFDETFVYHALQELLPKSENDFNNFKDTIVDSYGNQGYLIHRGKEYIFQPFNQNEDVPMYYRNNYHQDLLNKLSLYNFMRNTIDWKVYKSRKHKQDDLEKSIFKETIGYDFDTIRDYYDARDENDVVGIIDREVSRRKTRRPDEILDVFKIRSKRDKILDKKRGTGIPSMKGAVCDTSKPKDYLEKTALSFGAEFKLDDPTVSRKDLCDMIREKALEREKYNTENKTYIVIPANHPELPYPYNIHDRVVHRTNIIKTEIKNVVVKTTPVTGKLKKGKSITIGYDMVIKVPKDHPTASKKLTELGAQLGKGGEWLLTIR